MDSIIELFKFSILSYVIFLSFYFSKISHFLKISINYLQHTIMIFVILSLVV